MSINNDLRLLISARNAFYESKKEFQRNDRTIIIIFDAVYMPFVHQTLLIRTELLSSHHCSQLLVLWIFKITGCTEYGGVRQTNLLIYLYTCQSHTIYSFQNSSEIINTFILFYEYQQTMTAILPYLINVLVYSFIEEFNCNQIKC